MNTYYVYIHREKDTGLVFYVGKGSGPRANQSGNRSDFWKKVAKKHGWTAEIIEGGMTEEKAYERETYYIAHYRGLGQAKCNVSDGGDGVRVLVRWWGAKISAAQIGRKGKIGEENASYLKHVKGLELAKEYASGIGLVELAKKHNCSSTTIWSRLKSVGVSRREAGRSKVGIMCVDDGKMFASQMEAARHYGVYRENIRKVLLGHYKSTGGKRFVYAKI